MAEKMKFEKAIKGLEKIVDELESGDVALDVSLKKYEEGVKLARICQAQLAEAEKKIELLSRKSDGSFEKKDFDAQELEDDKTPAKSKSRKKEAEEEDEEFLL